MARHWVPGGSSLSGGIPTPKTEMSKGQVSYFFGLEKGLSLLLSCSPALLRSHFDALMALVLK